MTGKIHTRLSALPITWKVVALLLAVFSVLIVAQYLVLNCIVLEPFKTLERHYMEDHLKRVRNQISSSLENLSVKASDWAEWDDTYRYMKDRNEQYVTENLVIQSFRSLRISVIALADTAGMIVNGRYYDIDKDFFDLLPPEIATFAASLAATADRDAVPRRPAAGLLRTSRGLMMLTANAITMTDGSGRVNGFFIFASMVTDTFMKQIGRMETVNLAWSVLPDSDAHPGPRPALDQDSISVIGEDSICGVTAIGDLYGKRTLMLRVSDGRPVYRQGRRAVSIGNLFIHAEAFASILLTFLLLQRAFLTRLRRLNTDVARISLTRNTAQRVYSAGSDEIARLGAAVNAMLDSIQNARTRNEAILRALPDLLFVIDRNGTVLEYHAQSPEQLLMPPERFLGSNAGAILPPGISVPAMENIKRALESSAVQVFEYQVPMAGKTACFECRMVPCGPNEVLSIIRDMTAHRMAEEALAASRERVHSQELQQADKMASLGILVSGVAHEINNPNHLITLNHEVLKRWWPSIMETLDEHARLNPGFTITGLPYADIRQEIPELLDGVNEGARRIRKIVQNLKDFARPDSGSMDEVVDIAKVIDSTVVILSNLIKRSTTRFSAACAADLPCLKGNAQRIEQVVINLVSNACQALTNPEQTVAVNAYRDPQSGGAVIEVHDGGGGIRSEDLAKIYDPFYTTKRDQGGTGLGLSVSYAIVREHGGTMAFASEVGRGTVATVRLPAMGRV